MAARRAGTTGPGVAVGTLAATSTNWSPLLLAAHRDLRSFVIRGHPAWDALASQATGPGRCPGCREVSVDHSRASPAHDQKFGPARPQRRSRAARRSLAARAAKFGKHASADVELSSLKNSRFSEVGNSMTAEISGLATPWLS